MIIILTKADTLKVPAVFQLMKEQGLEMREAMPKVADFAAQMLSKLRRRIENELNGSKYPPKNYVSMSSRSSEILYYNCSNINIIMQI